MTSPGAHGVNPKNGRVAQSSAKGVEKGPDGKKRGESEHSLSL